MSTLLRGDQAARALWVLKVENALGLLPVAGGPDPKELHNFIQATGRVRDEHWKWLSLSHAHALNMAFHVMSGSTDPIVWPCAVWVERFGMPMPLPGRNPAWCLQGWCFCDGWMTADPRAVLASLESCLLDADMRQDVLAFMGIDDEKTTHLCAVGLAARRLHVSPRQVRRMIQQHTLRAVRLPLDGRAQFFVRTRSLWAHAHGAGKVISS